MHEHTYHITAARPDLAAWGTNAVAPGINVALASSGAIASASSTYSTAFPASGTINGDRKGVNWGSGGGWNDSTFNTFPDWLEIDFNGSKTINEIDGITVQDNLGSPIEPTQATTFSSYGTTGYDAQYWDGSSWVTVAGGGITGNNKVWRQILFSAVTTTKIRVLINATADGASRLAEVEAWGTAEASGSTAADVEWLVTDQLGTPRMIFDKTGSLANMKRHDYLPFGEELTAGIGQRSPTQGYSATDGVRQKFTAYERDLETGLDYAQARYHSSTQGRFTSVDPLIASAHITNPQSWNRYSYVLNKPLNLIDPSGLSARSADGGCSAEFGRCDEEESGSQAEKDYEARFHDTYEVNSANAAPWPPETHDKILALVLLGADDDELIAAQGGSRDVDWSQDSLIPETLNPLEAFKHGMVPGPWVDSYGLQRATDSAKAAAAEFIATNLLKAKEWFAYAEKAQTTSSWLAGFRYYGMAMHTVMDIESPAHQWAVYRLTGMFQIDAAAAADHRRMESRLPTREEQKRMMAQMHAALRSVVSESLYQRLTHVRR